MDNEGENKFCFAIDRGGTFTDIYAIVPCGERRVMKLLSVDPDHYSDAPTEGIRRIVSQYNPSFIDEKGMIDERCIKWIRMGTTVATNALLERKGERVAFLVTSGFKDMLVIGNQTRCDLFDLNVKHPVILYETVVEIDERIYLSQDVCKLNLGSKVRGVRSEVSNETVFVVKELNEKLIRQQLLEIQEMGIESLAVTLVHAYIYPQHEIKIAHIAREMGFKSVSISSEVMSMAKVVPRCYTTVIDAYLTPSIVSYVKHFRSGFLNGLNDVDVTFMRSDGGLTSMDSFNGCRAILSGPAGGYVGYARTTSHFRDSFDGVIGFDMGGTSTDVSRFDFQNFEHIFESKLSDSSGIVIQIPQLDIQTVASGGGSILSFSPSGLFEIGPESAGANPGPICYRRKHAKHLTVTDANLLLNRISAENFPSIFGDNQDESLDREASVQAFKELTDRINEFLKSSSKLSCEEVACGFIRIANETMTRPIKTLTQGRGHVLSRHMLACFGGAGGQHACSVARILGLKQVIVNRYSGILSAYGLALADVVHDKQVPLGSQLFYLAKIDTLNETLIEMVVKQIENLKSDAFKSLNEQQFFSEDIDTEVFLNLRYHGTDTSFMCKNETLEFQKFVKIFVSKHEKEFGFVLHNRDILLDDVRVRCVAKRSNDISQIEDKHNVKNAAKCEPVSRRKIYFDGLWMDSDIYEMSHVLNLSHEVVLNGPLVILDQHNTILVEPNCSVSASPDCQNLIILIDQQCGKSSYNLSPRVRGGKFPLEVVDQNCEAVDPIWLSVFSHRFMSIGEEMGRVLQQTSISTNIKERLDFSCALFDSDGGLVSNAPHIPVHLGAMQEAVKYQILVAEESVNGFAKGEVLLSNHPQAGGSHLPDLTVITPVFHDSIPNRPIFFVANRGHHADIGGKTPGSMPSDSQRIEEEGATFKHFKLVKNGIFQEEGLLEVLAAPGRYPGCQGARCVSDNVSDLKAQVAANQKGIGLVNELIDKYGYDVVSTYMKHIQSNAELAVRNMLKEFATSTTTSTKGSWDEKSIKCLSSVEYMDDGSKIALEISIDVNRGSAVFDFSGTSCQSFFNINAPRAITLSAIIYCLRSLINRDIPLNQGCLKPIDVRVPKSSLLDPDEGCAVIGGNVLTSQRIVDVILKAFRVCGASQGCCNNLTFGDDTFGYYETIGGGSGATREMDGRSGVHVHMTNTRMTDVEILERRYPVVIDTFSLAPNTGGRGERRGGDGIQRNLIFRKSLSISVLTERRALAPYGMSGGEEGVRGLNLLRRGSQSGGTFFNLGGKCSCSVSGGDMLMIRTPGGGGYGAKSDS